MRKIIKQVSIFIFILGLARCGSGEHPKSDFGSDMQNTDVRPGRDMGADTPLNQPDMHPNVDLGRDFPKTDMSDIGPDVEQRPKNAPRFPRTFIDLYGDIVNHQNTDPSNFTAERLTIVDGKVLDDKGDPLVGAKISAPDFPDIGYVFSDTDGNFSFALNGGGVVNLRYTKTGFIDSERRVQ